MPSRGWHQYWTLTAQTLLSMLQNYFKVAIRNLFRTKIFSLINILGLSLGVACCLLLALYVQDEFSYDRHHERLDEDRKSTRLNSSHVKISYAVFCLKKK